MRFRYNADYTFIGSNTERSGTWLVFRPGGFRIDSIIMFTKGYWLILRFCWDAILSGSAAGINMG